MPAGVRQVIWVSLTTTTEVAAVPSTVTAGVPGELFRKPVPVRVTAVPPREVPAEGEIEVRVGTGFSNNNAGTPTVTFDGNAATSIVVDSDTQITCDTPAGTAGLGVDVVVTNANGTATLSSGYNYHPEPTLTAVSPASGFPAGGTAVTLTGTGFSNNNAGTPTVTFDGNAATSIVVVSDTSITCNTPAGTEGTDVDVVVSNANGTATLSSGFAYTTDLPALADNDSRLAYGEGSQTELRVRTRDDSADNWSAEGLSTVAGSTVRWVVHELAPPEDDEELYATLSDDGSSTELDLLRWDGSAWSVDWTATSVPLAEVDKRGFDAAYERSSGDALVVYSDGSSTPLYRTRSGGTWSSAASLPLNDGGGPNPDTNSGTVLWIELVARAGSDEIGLAFVDDADDLVVMVWDGTQWVTASASTLETAVHTNAVSGVASNRVFDLAYEEVSGDLMAAWGQLSASGFHYSIKPAGSNTWGAATQVSAAPSGGSIHHLDLASEPGADRIAAGAFDLGDGAERLGLATWDGSGWVNAGEYDSQIRNFNDTATGDFAGAVGWIGRSGIAICVYPDNQSATLDWASWTADVGWAVQSDVSIAGKGQTESIRIVDFPERDLLMVVLSDDSSDLYAATYDGATWIAAQGGSPLETSLSSITTMPFDLQMKQLEPALHAISPGSGPAGGGTSVTLTGSGFQDHSPGTNTVTFDGMAATSVVVVDDTTITCTTPAGTAGAGVEVIVSNSNGTGVRDDRFFYTASPAALATDDARLTYGQRTAAQPRFRTWDESAGSWSSEGAAAAVGQTPVWTVGVPAPPGSSEELLAALVDDGFSATLELLRWNGSAWSSDWSATPLASDPYGDVRGFDAAYEDDSGDALVVYTDGSDTPQYRTRSGGSWSAAAALPLNDGGGPNPDTNSGDVRWVELVSRPESDELGLGFVDDNDDLVAIVWDGTQWVTASATTLDTAVKVNPVSGEVDNRAFDLAYEQDSGDLLAAWGRESASGFRYSTKAAGSNSWAASAAVSAAPSSGEPHFLDLAAEPGGDRIAAGAFDMGDGTERLGLATWTGSSWADAGEYDSQTWDVNDTGTGDFAGAVGWVGRSGVAVCVYPDDQTGTLDWARWTSGSGWAVQTDVTVSGKGHTESVAIQSILVTDELLAAFSDDNFDLYAATYDGTTWTLTNGGSALETDLSSVTTSPLDLRTRRPARPVLTSVSASSGTSLGGTSVTLTGTGFQADDAGTPTVTFDGNAATSIVVVNDTTITCDTPAGTAGSSVDVVVANDNGTTTLSSGYTYHPVPTLSSVSPTSGTSLGGTSVTLTGTGFSNNSPGTNTVTFDGNAATSVVVVSDTSITCDTPAGTAGSTVDVVVSNTNGTATLSSSYTYHPVPTLTSVSPTSGTSLGGTSITLTGTGFSANSPGTNSVTVDGNAATSVVVVSDTSITCDTPAGTAGATVDVVVSNANGSATLSSSYSYHPAPAVTSVSPTSGTSLGGTSITITGSGFSNNSPGTNTVTVDGNAATSVVVVSDTSITCDTPAGTAGASVDVVVSNANGTGTLSSGYTYHPAPTVSSVSPATGPSTGGTSVTITGTGFSNNSPGTNTVTFDGNAATSVVTVSDTSITCDTPAGANGPVDVVVSNDNGVATLSSGFTYTGGPSASNSSVSASPSFGTAADGTATVTITVTVRDDLSTPLMGETVQISATGTGNTVVQPMSTTDASGVATGTIASTLAEVKTISAVVDPGGTEVAITGTATAEFVWPTASTYYVRKTGSDSNTGTSPAEAWLTIGKAGSTVAAGDTVYVGAGTYTESVTLTTDGTASDPIQFIADSGGDRTDDAGDVIVDATGGSFAVKLDKAPYYVIEGFVVTGATGGGSAAGIAVEGGESEYVVLRGNTSYGNKFGLRLVDGPFCVLESNRISNNTEQGVEVHKADDTVLRNNLVYNNSGRGIEVHDSTNAIVEANTLYLNSDKQIDVHNGATVTVRNNVVTDGLAEGIKEDGSSTITSTYNNSWNNSSGNWSGVSMGTGDISMDPGYADVDGADNLLGGAEGTDDQFQLDTIGPSASVDAGSTDANLVALSDETHLADRTTRTDELLDGKSPDGDTVNQGYHYAVSTTDVTALEADDGRLAYGPRDANGALRQPELRTWDDSGSSWSSPGVAHPSGTANGELYGLIAAHSPLNGGEELLLAFSVDDSNSLTELDLQRFTGTEWVQDWTATAIDKSEDHVLGFDLAYEQLTGDALVVYSDATDTPVYRTRVQGVWSAETSLPLNDGGGPNPDPNTGTVRWIELEHRPEADEIGLLYADDNDDLVAIVWDGTQWLTASASALETTLKENVTTGLVDNRTFDLAYAGATGDLMAAWGRQAQSGFVWSMKTAGSNSWSTAAVVSSGFGDESDFVDLAGEPRGNRIAGVFCDREGDPERLAFSIWYGANWVDNLEVDSDMRDTNGAEVGDFPAGLAWVGTTGKAVCVYADDTGGNLDWVQWDSLNGWVQQTDVSISGKGLTESVRVEGFADQDKVMAVLTDTNSDLFAATYDGTSWTVTNSGSALETMLTNVDAMTFALALRDATPTSGSSTLDVRVGSSSDDAEEDGGVVNLTSSDLELGNGDGNDYEAMRFTGIEIPQGATITSAYLEFTVDEATSGTTNVTFQGEDADDAATFTTATNDISSRTTTTASVAWNGIAAWNAPVGDRKQSADLTSVLQEIVDRPGWSSGNALVIIATGTGSRVAESYDGDSEAAPLLHVEFD